MPCKYCLWAYPAALQPNLPHLKLLRERGSFMSHCCAINRYFDLLGQLIALWPVKEVAASAAAALM